MAYGHAGERAMTGEARRYRRYKRLPTARFSRLACGALLGWLSMVVGGACCVKVVVVARVVMSAANDHKSPPTAPPAQPGVAVPTHRRGTHASEDTSSYAAWRQMSAQWFGTHPTLRQVSPQTLTRKA